MGLGEGAEGCVLHDPDEFLAQNVHSPYHSSLVANKAAAFEFSAFLPAFGRMLP